MLPPASIGGLEASANALHQKLYQSTSEMASSPLIQGKTASATDLHNNLSSMKQADFERVHGMSQPIGLEMERVGQFIDFKV